MAQNETTNETINVRQQRYGKRNEDKSTDYNTPVEKMPCKFDLIMW